MDGLQTITTTVDRSSTAYTQRLWELVQQRLTIAQDLLTVTQAQSQSHSGQELSATLRLLAQKESLIDQLLRLDDQLHIYRQDDPQHRVWANPQLRQSCDQLLQQTNQRLKEVLELDGQTLQWMSQQRDALAAQLKHGQDTRLAEHAYSTADLLAHSTLDIADL
ncbi:MAG: hypothetical protein KF752_15805 [Pirellulaceae bacterium]|nr:hypothetical protein [Pirellulaceae bacterium]